MTNEALGKWIVRSDVKDIWEREVGTLTDGMASLFHKLAAENAAALARAEKAEGQVNDLRHAIKHAVLQLHPSGQRSLLQEALNATNPDPLQSSST